jgi:hypothetical protein
MLIDGNLSLGWAFCGNSAWLRQNLHRKGAQMPAFGRIHSEKAWGGSVNSRQWADDSRSNSSDKSKWFLVGSEKRPYVKHVQLVGDVQMEAFWEEQKLYGFCYPPFLFWAAEFSRISTIS